MNIYVIRIDLFCPLHFRLGAINVFLLQQQIDSFENLGRLRIEGMILYSAVCHVQGFANQVPE
jgi:hypothetical protein